MNDWLKMNLKVLIHLHTFPYIHTQKKEKKCVASNSRKERNLVYSYDYWNKNLDTPSIENIPGSTPCPNVLKLNTVYPIVFHRSIWNYDYTIVFIYIIIWNHSRLDSVSDCLQIFFFSLKNVYNPWFLTQFKFKKK